MSVIIVDSSTIISCAMNCVMWVFDELKQKVFREMCFEAVNRTNEDLLSRYKFLK